MQGICKKLKYQLQSLNNVIYQLQGDQTIIMYDFLKMDTASWPHYNSSSYQPNTHTHTQKAELKEYLKHKALVNKMETVTFFQMHSVILHVLLFFYCRYYNVHRYSFVFH